MLKLIPTLIAASACVLLTAGPAAATDAPKPFVLVAWSIGDPAHIWVTPQVYVDSVALEVAGLDALDSSLPCGTYFQLDLYNAGGVTDSLIAGGHLDGPSNPVEDLAHGAVAGNPWKYLQTPDCIQPADVVTAGQESVRDCLSRLVVTHHWHDTITYTGDARGFTAQPSVRTIDPDTSVPATAVECPPVALLPVTGTESLWLLPVSALVMSLGVLMVRRARLNRP